MNPTHSFFLVFHWEEKKKKKKEKEKKVLNWSFVPG